MKDFKNNQPHRKCLSAMIAMISIVMIGAIAWQPSLKANGLPSITLTVVALDGTQVVLHENDIGNLAPYTAYGGYVKSTGALGGLGYYTGVPISTFVNMAGVASNGYSVKITAIDNYSKILSYEALNGTGLITYDNVTGQVVHHNQTLTPMLAYYYNDTNLPSGGPLRLAIAGPEGLLTQSSLWVSNVVRLEVHPNLQPMNLTVVALNGTSITLDQTAMSNLAAIRAVGGFRNKLGFVRGLGNYTGPTLDAFCNLVGGLNSNNALRVTAVDGYTLAFSYDMVNGAFTTYDPVTGNPVPHSQPLTPVLAYHFNDVNLTAGPSADGPLRLAIVGSEGLATFSSYWVKQVVKLEIRYIDDVAVTAVTPLKTIIGQNNTCSVNVTVANSGGYGETFNVTAFTNQTAFGMQAMALSAGSTMTITLTWNTTGFAYGNYTMSVSATTVPDETNTTNNAFTDGRVKVTLIGDVNGDGKVNLQDTFQIALAFGSSPAQPNWNPNLDINGDGKINLQDCFTASLNFGKSL